MTQIRDEAVVLRTYRLGEADRIVVMMTAAHGKERAVAKGVRKTTSRYGARLEPMSHLAVQLWKGRSELGTINQVEVIEPHLTIRRTLDRLARGLVLVEAVEQLAQEGHPDPALFAMLTGALRTLDDSQRRPELIVPAFLLKALVLEGAGPVLDGCALCGRDDSEVELVAFSMEDGGMVCRDCRRGRAVSPPALSLMRRMLQGGLGGLLSGTPPDEADEVASLASEVFEWHIDRRLRSLRAGAGL